MKKKYEYNFSLVLIILFSFAFICCEHDEMNDTKNKKASMEIPVDFIKLIDDSTNVAGLVEVKSSISQLNVRWNIPPECNIDTTQTVFETNNGRCQIPVKWIEKNKEGIYGPMTKAFDGGLLVSTGELSQYVRLIWADEVDSTKITSQKNIATRSTEPLPRNIIIELTPETVDMDKEVGGGIYVDYSGAPVVYVDRSRIPASSLIDKTKIDMFLNAPGPILLNWIDGKAPDANFSTMLRFTAGDITKIGYINYVIEQETPAIWEFIDSTPSEGNTVLANEANIIVKVRTNKPWSLECEQGLTSPVSDLGTAYEVRSLVMPLRNNTTSDQREIKVLVKSQGILQKTLIFTQMGQGQTGVLDFLSAVPVDKSTLPGETTSVDVTVQSDVAWWIKCDCGKRMDYPASALGEKTGTVTITENTTGEPRVITVTVGYGDKVVKTLNYVQNVSGGIDPNATLVYDSSTLPTGNIAKDGGTYTFTFTGTYTGEVQVRTLIDGVAQTPGASVTNKQPQTSVPANTLTTTRNITFQYKRADGDWTALPASTNRVQDGNGGGGGDTQTLTYVSSTLPTGNIPASATVYTFNFEGGYTGQFRVRSVNADTGEVLFNGPIGTTHSPKVTVPANTAATTRNIKFQYRMIDIASSSWMDLPASTDRIQDADNEGDTPSGGNISLITISPQGDLSEYGAELKASFQGSFKGNIDIRAISGSEVLITASGKVNTSIPLSIPQLFGLNRIIIFEYSLDGGINWLEIERRNQINETFSAGLIQPRASIIPAGGQALTWSFQGTYSRKVIWRAYTMKETLAEITANGPTLSLIIPENNTGESRTVNFMYKLEGRGWTGMETRVQLAE